MSISVSQLHLDRLIQFHTAARHGSLKRAAELLALTPPALTRSLQKLEEELGVTLCRRGRTARKDKVGGEVLCYVW